jgi:hypothetical protein
MKGLMSYGEKDGDNTEIDMEKIYENNKKRFNCLQNVFFSQ